MTNSLNKLKRMLAERIQTHHKSLSAWHLDYARSLPPPFYCSVDLRDSGHKIVPVDSNLYPAGFNNICPDDLRTAPAVVRAQIEALAARLQLETPRQILIIPESHTKNTYYIENLYFLLQILDNAGFETALGWYDNQAQTASSDDPIELVSNTGKQLRAHPIRIDDNGLARANGFIPDVILLNNDFSSGYPKLLDSISQPILPSHVLGWHSRKKSEHFRHYNRLAREFASIIDIDPWIIQIETDEIGPVNFNEDKGVEQVASTVKNLLERIDRSYNERKIQQKPFVFIKNNHGTYGMGIMVVRSAEELKSMNRRTKNKMSVGKNSLPISSVIVQEGIPTATLINRLAAEPVIYLVGCELIGGFLRTNSERNTEDNLNSQGMVFKKLCMSDLKQPDDAAPAPALPTLELVYGSIARIAALATGIELAERSENNYNNKNLNIGMSQIL